MRMTLLTISALAFCIPRMLAAQLLLVDEPNLKPTAKPDGPAYSLTLVGDPAADPFHIATVKEFSPDGLKARVCFATASVDACGWLPLTLFYARAAATVPIFVDSNSSKEIGMVLIGTVLSLRQHQDNRYLAESQEHYPFWVNQGDLTHQDLVPDTSLALRSGNPRFAPHKNAKLLLSDDHKQSIVLRDDTYLRVERTEGKLAFVHVMNCLSTVQLDGWMDVKSYRRVCPDNQDCEIGYSCESESITRRTASIQRPPDRKVLDVAQTSPLLIRPDGDEIGTARAGLRVGVLKTEGEYSEVYPRGNLFMSAWIKTSALKEPTDL